MVKSYKAFIKRMKDEGKKRQKKQKAKGKRRKAEGRKIQISNRSWFTVGERVSHGRKFIWHNAARIKSYEQKQTCRIINLIQMINQGFVPRHRLQKLFDRLPILKLAMQNKALHQRYPLQSPSV